MKKNKEIYEEYQNNCQTKEKKEKDLSNKEQDYKKLKANITEYYQEKEKKDELERLTEKIKNGRQEIKILKEEIKDLELKDEEYQKGKIFLDKLDKIEENKLLKEKIDKALDKIKKLREELSELIEKKYKNSAEIDITKTKHDEIMKQIKNVDKIKDEIKVYKIFLQILNDIKYKIMSKVLPIISMSMNRILNTISNASVKLDIVETTKKSDNNEEEENEKKKRKSKKSDDIEKKINEKWKNYIYVFKYDDMRGDRKASMLCGSESFIFSVALRLTLIKINMRSKTNFLMIDEGWGNLDEFKFKTIPLIYNLLREEFKFVILVSHIPEFKNNVDKELEIDINDKEFSRIDI